MTAGIVKTFGVALIWLGRHCYDSSHALHTSHTTNDECTHKNYRELPVFSVREKPIQYNNGYQSSDHGSGNRSADCHKSLAKMSGGSVGLLGHGSNKVWIPRQNGSDQWLATQGLSITRDEARESIASRG